MEMKEEAFTFDGNHYKVENTAKCGINDERVIVWTLDDDLLADATISDTFSNIEVMYNTPDNEINETTTFPYHDYSGTDKVIELAKWMIATHPNMA